MMGKKEEACTSEKTVMPLFKKKGVWGKKSMVFVSLRAGLRRGKKGSCENPRSNGCPRKKDGNVTFSFRKEEGTGRGETGQARGEFLPRKAARFGGGPIRER